MKKLLHFTFLITVVALRIIAIIAYPRAQPVISATEMPSANYEVAVSAPEPMIPPVSQFEYDNSSLDVPVHNISYSNSAGNTTSSYNNSTSSTVL